jgi:hypothetical protein
MGYPLQHRAGLEKDPVLSQKWQLNAFASAVIGVPSQAQILAIPGGIARICALL